MVATITLNRPGQKNPIIFESYAEPRGTFISLVYPDDVKAVVIAGAGGNFCFGGDVHDIIGSLRRGEKEATQKIIDKAVQLFGGLGVTKGVKVEELYREIRALRIYQGASEVQKLVIAEQPLKAEIPTGSDTVHESARSTG